MKNLLNVILEFFRSFFRFRNIQFFDLIEEYEDYLCGHDLTKHDTLVGTVKSREQYDTNIKHNFYHIPERFVEFPEDIEYVALYRSKNLFEKDEPGVTHYGRVISCEKVKRRDIKELYLSFNPDDYYYRFEVSAWQELEVPVIAREAAPHVAVTLNRYLLENSKYGYELLISNNEMFKLNLGLIDITNSVYDGFFVGDTKVYTVRSKIIVLSPRGKYVYKVTDYKRKPLATLEMIYLHTFEQS